MSQGAGLCESRCLRELPRSGLCGRNRLERGGCCQPGAKGSW